MPVALDQKEKEAGAGTREAAKGGGKEGRRAFRAVHLLRKMRGQKYENPGYALAPYVAKGREDRRKTEGFSRG